MPRPHLTAQRCLLLTVATVLAVTGLSGCDSSRPGTSPAGRVTGTLTVLASTSLTEVVTWLKTVLETAHPGLRVVASFTSDTQVIAGAGPRAADIVLVEGPQPLTGLGPTPPVHPVVFARNQMVIAVTAGDPLKISRLADLGRPGIRLAMCEPAQPCGATAAAALAAVKVRPSAAILRPDVRAALAAVADGAADAALVYRTDVRAATNHVDTVEFTESRTAIIAYQAVVVATAPNPNAAAAFLALLTLPSTLDVLTRAGFQPPS